MENHITINLKENGVIQYKVNNHKLEFNLEEELLRRMDIILIVKSGKISAETKSKIPNETKI
jgi:hypothetical protein